jgi:thioredoxin-like negative regulator of GroEL
MKNKIAYLFVIVFWLYKIAVVPTIIIFKDGEEVARFQADLSFKMVATREEVQEEINDQLMSDF